MNKLTVQLRTEDPADHVIVNNLIQRAFKDMAFSDHTEHFLVKDLRTSPNFVPSLSIVALLANRIVGYILLTPIQINSESNSKRSLALAPVVVDPDLRGKKIGSQLIEEGHRRATELGFDNIVLIGHHSYYPRFGYKPCYEFGIEVPFNAQPQNVMIHELVPGAMENIRGNVEYPPEFFVKH